MKLGKTSLTLATIAALMAFSPLSFSQDKSTTSNKPATSAPDSGTPRRRAGANQFNTLVERLKLNDEQQKKLRPIYDAQAAKLRELRQDTSLNTQQRREKSREIRSEYDPKFKEVLTADQFEQYKKMQQGNRPTRRNSQTPPASSDSNSQNKDK